MSGTASVAWSLPASSANLGSGFDALAVALEWRLTVVTCRGAAESPQEGLDRLATEAAREVWQEVGEGGTVSCRVSGTVPPGRGLGTSACAVAGGLLGAVRLAGRAVDPAALLPRAARREGHADNAAAALLGGLTWSWLDRRGEAQARRLPLPPLRAALFVPEVGLDTPSARAALPAAVPLGDAVHNLQRAGLWPVALLLGDLSLLAEAAEDRLHQPYRAAYLPHLEACLEAARRLGAPFAGLSGSGSSVLALAEADLAPEVAAAMARAAARCGVPGEARVVGLAAEGPLPVPAAASREAVP